MEVLGVRLRKKKNSPFFILLDLFNKLQINNILYFRVGIKIQGIFKTDNIMSHVK
jgi:hypothetical protein